MSQTESRIPASPAQWPWRPHGARFELAPGPTVRALRQARPGGLAGGRGAEGLVVSAGRADRLARHQALGGIRALARAIDAKDPSTRLHSERVAALAERLARLCGWSSRRARALHEAGLLHDVGKIGVPDAILFKPSPLTRGEYEQIKQHAPLGGRIVAEVLTLEQAGWVRHHHERWDGAGYPDGLRAEAISEGARLLALADAWDVMTGARNYGTPRSPGDALDECVRESGRQFCPRAVEALLRLVDATVR
jgi:HD-GYP domain-containing protein (c-di-GMP phosphodiesterase class II)